MTTIANHIPQAPGQAWRRRRGRGRDQGPAAPLPAEEHQV